MPFVAMREVVLSGRLHLIGEPVEDELVEGCPWLLATGRVARAVAPFSAKEKNAMADKEENVPQTLPRGGIGGVNQPGQAGTDGNPVGSNAPIPDAEEAEAGVDDLDEPGDGGPTRDPVADPPPVADAEEPVAEAEEPKKRGRPAKAKD